jgi:hypothetical protein
MAAAGVAPLPVSQPPAGYPDPSGPPANDNWSTDAANDNAVAEDAVVEETAADTVTEGTAETVVEGAAEEEGVGLLELLVEGIGAAGAATAAAVGVLLYPASTEPGWMDAWNPITGRFYTSQEEYDQVHQMSPEEIAAKVAARRKADLENASQESSNQTCNAVGDPVQTCSAANAEQPDQSKATDTAADTEDDEQKKSCATEYPDLNLCTELPAKYVYNSESAAFSAIKSALQVKNLKKVSYFETDSGPCPGQGQHIGVKDGGTYVASIVSCPCCVDTEDGPVLSERFAVIWKG